MQEKRDLPKVSCEILKELDVLEIACGGVDAVAAFTSEDFKEWKGRLHEYILRGMNALPYLIGEVERYRTAEGERFAAYDLRPER